MGAGRSVAILPGQSHPFCDTVSFVVMQRLGVKRVAAFDDHFRQFGGFGMIG